MHDVSDENGICSDDMFSFGAPMALAARIERDLACLRSTSRHRKLMNRSVIVL